MKKLYEEDGLLNTLESVSEPNTSSSDIGRETNDVPLPPGVVYFAPRRRAAAASILQTEGARLFITIAESASIVLTSLIAGVGYHELALSSQGDVLAFLSVGLLTALLFSGAMRWIEDAQRLRAYDSPEAMRDVILVWLTTFLCVTFFAFSLKAGGALSRGSMLTFLVLGYLGVSATRTIVPRLLMKYRRPNGLVAHQVIVIGAKADPGLDVLLSELNSAGYAAPRVVRFDAKCGLRDWQRELPESMTRVLALARTTADGEICIAAGGFDDQRLRDIILGLQIVPRAVRIVPTAQTEQLLHYPVRTIGNLHSVELQKAPLNATQLLIKRSLDIVAASLLLLLFAPMFVLIALGIKLDSRGPVFFRQTRLGHRGVPFDIFKFRTMTVVENGDDVKQAQANDRRVTRLGRFLRKTSIDELPQLLNVIRGEMSLVGPRPHAIAHDRHYTTLIDNYEIRQHVKPGITGWAQVNGLRGETASPDLMRRRIEFDIWYATNATILLDMRILLLTVVAVFRQDNAY